MASFFSGGTPNTSNKAFYNGKISFIRSGEIHSSNTQIKISEDGLEASSAKLVEKGDILIALYGANSGDIAISQIQGAINQAILCVRPYYGVVKDYLLYAWQKNYSGIVTKYLQGGQGNLSAELIRQIKFWHPSLSEQKKIAKFLPLIDERIEQQRQIIKERKTQKKALLNQLFNQQLRFPEFEDEWKKTTLGEIAESVTRKNDNSGTHPIMMISAEQGFIHQSQKYDRENTGDSLSKYTLLYKGELAYNRGASKHKIFGSVFVLQERSAVIPYVYHSFKFDNTKHSSFFWGYYLNSHLIDPLLRRLVSSSARMDGLLNITKDCFFSLPISQPSLSEQSKIASFLAKIDERIEVEEQLFQQYEQQKRYLLQKMFV